MKGRRNLFKWPAGLLLIPQGAAFLFYVGVVLCRIHDVELSGGVYFLTAVMILYVFAVSPVMCVAGIGSSILSAVGERRANRPFGRYIVLAVLHLFLETPIVILMIALFS